MLKKQFFGSAENLNDLKITIDKEWQDISSKADLTYLNDFSTRHRLLDTRFVEDRANRGLVPIGMSQFNLYKTLNNLKKQNIDPETFYILNSRRLRSDEFVKKHDGLHVLFAGCSITFGEGIPLEKTWSHMVYSKIKESSKISGYFNIAFPGATPTECIMQIEDYIEEFGNPDIIFFNIPDFEREYELSYRNSDGNSKIDSETLKLTLAHGKYDLFRRYCEKNNIKLFSFTWDIPETSNWEYVFNPLENLDRYYAYSAGDQKKYLFIYGEDHPEEVKNKTAYTALDDAHPGFGQNAFFADFIYDAYLKEKND